MKFRATIYLKDFGTYRDMRALLDRAVARLNTEFPLGSSSFSGDGPFEFNYDLKNLAGEVNLSFRAKPPEED